MGDLHLAAASEMSDDAMYQQIVAASIVACIGWAVAVVSAGLDMLLYPRDRGPIHDQRPYTVTQRTAEKGIWRIVLCPATALPAGVPPSTRDSVIRAQIARSAAVMSLPATDHVIQCGLFGEVLYR